MQANTTMLRSAGVQKPKRPAKVSAGRPQGEKPVQYYPAPANPGQTPCETALSSEPRFTDELFEKYPPSKGWSEEDLKLIKAECRGQKMLAPSPTLEQLHSWKLESYEQFCVLNAYELP